MNIVCTVSTTLLNIQANPLALCALRSSFRQFFLCNHLQHLTNIFTYFIKQYPFAIREFVTLLILSFAHCFRILNHFQPSFFNSVHGIPMSCRQMQSHYHPIEAQDLHDVEIHPQCKQNSIIYKRKEMRPDIGRISFCCHAL